MLRRRCGRILRRDIRSVGGIGLGFQLPRMPDRFATAAERKAEVDVEAAKRKNAPTNSAADTETIHLSTNQAAIAVEKGKRASQEFENGKMEIAARFWEESIAKLEKSGHGTSPVIIPPLNNLACVYGELGFTRPKLQLAERCVSVVRATYGSRHPQYVVAISNLADVKGELFRLEEKKELCIEALNTQLDLSKGKVSAKVARCNLALADVELKLGNPTESVRLYEAALAVVERHCGPTHPQTAATHSDLGLACAEIDPFKGREHISKALEIEKQIFGPHHPQQCANLCRLSKIELACGNENRRKELLDEAMDLLQRNAPKTDIRPESQEVDLGPPVSFPSACSRDWMLHLRLYAQLLSEYADLLDITSDEETRKRKLVLANDAFQVALRCYPPAHHSVAEYIIKVAAVHHGLRDSESCNRWKTRGDKMLRSALDLDASTRQHPMVKLLETLR